MALKGLFAETTASGTGDLPGFSLAFTPGSTDWSAVAFVWIDAVPAVGSAMVIGQLHESSDQSTTERGFAIGGRSHGPVLGAYVYSGSAFSFETVSTVPTGRWVHVGVSLKGGGQTALYIDGKEALRATSSAGVYPYGSPRIVFGSSFSFGTPFTVQKSRLRQAELAMWDVDLSASEMSDLARGRRRPSQVRYGRCFGYWPFNRSFINLRAPIGTPTDLSEFANFRLDQQSPFDGSDVLDAPVLSLGIRAKASAGADGSASGVTTTATASLIPGAATGNSAGSASGVTLTATASLIAGAASAASSAAGQTLTATASLLAGSASGNEAGSASGVTLTAASSLIAGSASGTANGSASGATLTATASLTAGSASGNTAGTANGVTLTASSSLIAGASSAASSAAGVTLAASSSILAGSASGASAGSAGGATWTATASLIAGGRTASSSIGGAIMPASVSLITGAALAGNPRPAASRVVKSPNAGRGMRSPRAPGLAKSA
jgi:hypothetical protein